MRKKTYTPLVIIPEPRFVMGLPASLLPIDLHALFGLQADIAFGEGCFSYTRVNGYKGDDLLPKLHGGQFNQYPLLKCPKEIIPEFNREVLGIYPNDSPEEVKRKLFEYNSKTTFVIRQLAKDFEIGANIPEAWCLTSNSVPALFQLVGHLNLKQEAAIGYLITCIRSAILQEDYRKREVQFHPDCAFNEFMYLGTRDSTSNTIFTYIDLNIFMTVYDLMTFLLCSYVHKDKEASSFMFLTWDDESLMKLPGMQSVYKNANLKVLRKVLCKLYMYISTFYTRVLQIEPEDESVIKDYSDLEIIKRIFKVISKLENYAMNFR